MPRIPLNEANARSKPLGSDGRAIRLRTLVGATGTAVSCQQATSLHGVEDVAPVLISGISAEAAALQSAPIRRRWESRRD
jgi:hypothetical protein